MILPVENFCLLLISKRKIEGNTVLVLPDIFCAMLPLPFSPPLCFQCIPVGAAAIGILVCTHSNFPVSREAALH